MIGYYTTEVEVCIDRDPRHHRKDGKGRFEYQLYTITAEVVVNDEWCELRSIVELSVQIESGEEVTLAINELPAAALDSLCSELADHDTRRRIYDEACEVDAEMEADLQRRIRAEKDAPQDKGNTRCRMRHRVDLITDR